MNKLFSLYSLSLSSIPTPYLSARRHAGRQDGGLRTYIFLQGHDPYKVRLCHTTNYRGPAPRKLGCLTHPHNGTPAAILHGQGRGGEGERPRTTGNARGFCPPSLGGAIFAPPFFNFGPGELHSGTLGAKMADSAHIYILRLVRSTTPRKLGYVTLGALPRES